MLPKNDEFYIGYIPKAPKKTSDFIRRIIIAIGFIVVAVSIMLVLHQRPFSTANFEYGVSTTVSGYVFTEPVPHIKQLLGKDLNGNPLYQTILVVGFGKAGANSVLENMERSSGTTLNGKFITLTGYLIYGDGKTLLQIREEDNSKAEIQYHENFPLATFSSRKGNVKIVGEVIDPKCYFGVMKPGEGKPHRSCAIRCIAGGIPPVLKSAEASNYFLLLGENLQPINESVLKIVGDQINIEGEVIEMENWKILKVNQEELKHLSESKTFLQNLITMNEGMTMCKK